MYACENIARLRSHTAAIACRWADILDQFVSGFEPACPAARGAFPLSTRTERFDAACKVARVAKLFGHIEAVEPWLRGVGRRLSQRGFGPEHGPAARASMLRAIRSCSGQNWSPEVEGDWQQALECVFSMMEAGMVAERADMPRLAAA